MLGHKHHNQITGVPSIAVVGRNTAAVMYPGFPSELRLEGFAATNEIPDKAALSTKFAAEMAVSYPTVPYTIKGLYSEIDRETGAAL
jgi:hypothetical protein